MKKAFPMHDILTMRTGIVHKDFKTAHELMEWIVGHPIWTHEMPSHSELVESEMERQFPFLPKKSSRETCEQILSDCIAQYGETLEVEQGSQERTTDPISSLLAWALSR